ICLYDDWMDKSHFIKLLRKYRQGSASIEECKFLLRYYEMFDAEPDIVAMLGNEKKLELKSQLQDDIWSDINRSQGRMQRKSLWRRMVKGMAAAAVLVFCIVGFLYFLVKSPEITTYLKDKVATKQKNI